MKELKSKKDLAGKIFGRLTVIKESFKKPPSSKSGGYRYFWECICSCDNKTVVHVWEYSLLNPKHPTRSCGCLHKEGLIKLNKERERKVEPKNDLSGKVFERLTVLQLSQKIKTYNKIYYIIIIRLA